MIAAVRLLPDSQLLLSLLVESVAESLILYFLALATFRVFEIRDPAQRLRFMLLPLVVPVVLGTAFHWLVEATRPFSSLKMAEGLLHDWLSPLIWIEPGLVIPFGLAALFGGWQVLQGLLVPILLRWHCAQGGREEDPLWLRCHRLLNRLLAIEGRHRRRPRVILHHTQGICALGFWHPCILVQPALARALDDEELEAALAHELAHLRQGHSPLTFLARFCRNLMWFNPAAHLAYRRFVEYQEEAADDETVTLTDNSLALAASLVKGLRFRQGWIPAAGSALWGRGLPLERRILRLVHYQLPESTRQHRWLAPGLALVSILGFALLW